MIHLFRIVLLHHLHTLWFRRIVNALSLSPKSHTACLVLDHALGKLIRCRYLNTHFFGYRVAKSDSTCRSPITRRNLVFYLSIVAASTLGDPNAVGEFSMNSIFQRLILTGASYFTTCSIRVSLTLMDSNENIAVNLSSHFFLFL